MTGVALENLYVMSQTAHRSNASSTWHQILRSSPWGNRRVADVATHFDCSREKPRTAVGLQPRACRQHPMDLQQPVADQRVARQ